MCFMLFVGTDEPLPFSQWKKEMPDVWVRPVHLNERAINLHFEKRNVQYVGSTAGCGCDFPHWLLFNGAPPEHPEKDLDPAQAEANECSRQSLMKLLGRAKGHSIELYGVWAGNWSKPPIKVEEISIHQLGQSSFQLGEQVFYRVHL